MCSLPFELSLHTVFFPYTRKKNPTNVEKQMELLQDLMVNEIVEFMVPLSYLICFSVAYYGPNAKLIGNVGSSQWQFVAVDDFQHTFGFIALFFLVDLGSVVVSSLFLWMFCRIKLWNVYKVVQDEFGMTFTANLIANLNGVRKSSFSIFNSTEKVFIN